MDFIAEELQCFLQSARVGTWKGSDLRDLNRKQKLGLDPPDGYSAKAGWVFTREELKGFAEASEWAVSSEWVMWSVLSWGGFGRGNPARLRPHSERVASLVSELRSGELTRLEGFRRFSDLVETCGPMGLGPAFFTKLIFFAAPRHDGYIMDQWTGRSINLLTGRKVVKMDGQRVSPRNRAENYEEFCSLVELLADKLREQNSQATPEFAEMCLFSQGGQHHQEPHPWRLHVRQA